MTRGKEKWKRKGEERRVDEDFVFLFVKGFLFFYSG